MGRIDDVLALAMLHGFEGKGQARIAAIAVSSGDLRAAQFCDAVTHFYASATTGPAAMFAHFMPIGLADRKPAAETPMFGHPESHSSIQGINDTADAATIMPRWCSAGRLPTWRTCSTRMARRIGFPVK
jgi:hypothetical protein